MSYDNTNSGVLFKNDRKEKDSQPDYTGNLTDENGKKWRLAAWLKEGKNGKFMSIKLSEFQQRGDSDNTPAPSLDDDIPF